MAFTTLTSLFASFLCLLSLRTAFGASIVFIDNSEGSYLRRSQDDIENAQRYFSPSAVAAATATLLGVVPTTKIDSYMSAKLNDLLSPNLFKRPRGVITLNIAGLDSGVLNNGNALSAVGFPYHYERLLSSSQEPGDASSSDSSMIAKALSQSFKSLVANSGESVEVFPLGCSVKCSSKCISQELEALAAVVGAYYESPSESSKGVFIVNSGNSKITFDMSLVMDRIFTSDLACLLHNVKNRGSVHFNGVTDTPELLFGTITGLQVLKNHYGENAKTKTAETIVLKTITHCIDLLQEVYHGRVAGSIVFLGETDLRKMSYLKEGDVGVNLSNRAVRILEDSTDDSTTAATFIAKFLMIFSGVLLIITALLAIYALFSMPITVDSLIYSSPKLD